MARYHLKYRNFDGGTIAATEALFAAKPWRKTPEEWLEDANTWVRAVADVYGVPVPEVKLVDELDVFMGGVVPYANQMIEDEGTTPAQINLTLPSMITMFYYFRLHMLSNGVPIPGERTVVDDCHAWSCSLFYVVKPVMFRARVREGRIQGVYPEDLLRRPQADTVLPEQQQADSPLDDAIEDNEVAEEGYFINDDVDPDAPDIEFDDEITAGGVTPEFAERRTRARVELRMKPVTELRRMATRYSVPGWTNMRKDALVDALLPYVLEANVS